MNDFSLIKLFLEMLSVERNVSQKTQDAYKRDLLNFSKFLELNNLNFINCQTIDLEKWLKNLYMMDEIFDEEEGKQTYDQYELKIDFDFPNWLSQSHMPF